jgi:hypothetical protein
MAFLIYKKTTASGRARYEQLQPLRLGGRDGLIARHVRTVPSDDCASWHLDTAALLKLAGRDAAAEGLTVLFDIGGPQATNVCLYELFQVHGSCRDTVTELALDLYIVVDREIGAAVPAFLREFEVPVPDQPRRLAEILTLSGGPGGGDWKWGAPSLQLGAMIVPGRRQHTNGSPALAATRP